MRTADPLARDHTNKSSRSRKGEKRATADKETKIEENGGRGWGFV
jgi:hypothetical protein